MERERNLLEELGRISLRRNRIVRGAISLGIGFGSAGLVAGVIHGSSVEGVLASVVLTGSVGVRRALDRRQNRN